MEIYLWWRKDLVVTDSLVIRVLTSKILNERWVLISVHQALQISHALHQLVAYKFPALKKVDDVLGGQEAWKNVDSTEGMTYSTHMSN